MTVFFFFYLETVIFFFESIDINDNYDMAYVAMLLLNSSKVQDSEPFSQ